MYNQSVLKKQKSGVYNTARYETRKKLQIAKLSKEERRKQCVQKYKKKSKMKNKLEISNEIPKYKNPTYEKMMYKSKSITKPFVTLYNLVNSQYVNHYNECSENFDNNINNFIFQYEEASNWNDISDIELSNLLKSNFVNKKNNKYQICKNNNNMIISTQYNNITYQYSINEDGKLIQKNTKTETEREIRINNEIDKKSVLSKHMFYGPPFCTIQSKDYLKLMNQFAFLFHENYIKDKNGYNRAAIVGGEGGQIIANLATQFSKPGNGYQYDSSKCQLWIKPLLTQLVLQSCYFHNYDKILIVTHGSDSAKYNLMAQDPTGFKIEKSNDGAEGYGIYCALDDNVSKYYNKKQPEGCFIICLLFQKSNITNGGCTFFSYNSDNYDSVNIRDQMLLLPLGLAVAK